MTKKVDFLLPPWDLIKNDSFLWGFELLASRSSGFGWTAFRPAGWRGPVRTPLTWLDGLDRESSQPSRILTGNADMRRVAGGAVVFLGKRVPARLAASPPPPSLYLGHGWVRPVRSFLCMAGKTQQDVRTHTNTKKPHNGAVIFSKQRFLPRIN